MKLFLKTMLSCALALIMLLSLVSCSLLGGGDDGDFKANYKKQEITADAVSVIKSNLESKLAENSSYLKYTATYHYDLENSGSGYVYNNKYDVTMQVNGDAAVGEVFAYIELKSVYSQPDGNAGRDVFVKFCIVRTGEGENYSDYKVFVNLDDQTYSATFGEMLQAIEEADIYYVSGGTDEAMKDALDYEIGDGEYFEIILAYAATVSGKELVSITDYPFIYCLHDFNKDSFLSMLSELNQNSGDKGYKLYTDGDNKIKVTRKYKDKKFLEEYDNASYLWLNDDGTYSYRCVDMYKTDNPARAKIVNTEQVLNPLTDTIALPAWAK
ncbi:MAG: hypothetical protein E7585_06465 [Ruminococcaceae bacterium]|nr:hypothetical protein [Oscillospiraceae bacterium]